MERAPLWPLVLLTVAWVVLAALFVIEVTLRPWR